MNKIVDPATAGTRSTPLSRLISSVLLFAGLWTLDSGLWTCRAQFSLAASAPARDNPVVMELDARRVLEGNGEELPLWRDISHNGINFTEEFGGAFVTTAGFNGFKSVTGTLSRPGFISNLPMTVIAVIRSDATPDSDLDALIGVPGSWLLYLEAESAAELTVYNGVENARTDVDAYPFGVPFVLGVTIEKGRNPRWFVNGLELPNVLMTWTTFNANALNGDLTEIGIWGGSFPNLGAYGVLKVLRVSWTAKEHQAEARRLMAEFGIVP